MNVVCKSSESLPSFGALGAGLGGDAELALKVWDGARSFAISKWSPATCADTQSKGSQTRILQYEGQVAVLVELPVGSLVSVVSTGLRCSSGMRAWGSAWNGSSTLGGCLSS